MKGARRENIQTAIVHELERALALDQSSFPNHALLPPLYARGLPERAVETLFAHLCYRPGKRILDVGFANSMECHRMMLAKLPPPRHLTGIDIADPVYDASRMYEACVRADITRTPFADESFDTIWCISSLEHFGMDNTGYTKNFSTGATMDKQAVQEMLRLLTRGGDILVTVPYGRFEDHGTHKNFDRHHWQSLLDVARPVADVQEWYFRHTFGNGWHEVPPEELIYVGYFDQANAGAGGLAVTRMTKW